MWVAALSVAFFGPADYAKLVGDYSSWTMASPARVRMNDSVSVLCSATRRARSTSSPPMTKFVTVWVNGRGQEMMFQAEGREFPVGTTIVKEKFNGPELFVPELLTIMIKREKGYFPGVGDWEFAVAEMPAKKIVERGKLERCAACHRRQAARDFVFS